MKIKTSEWLGVEYSSRKSALRFKVFNSMWDAINEQPVGSTPPNGLTITPELRAARFEFNERINTDGKEWKHYLFTDKAVKLAEAIPVDDNFNYALLPTRPQSACYMPAPGEFFRWYTDEVGLMVMYMKDNGDNSVARYAFQINFGGGMVGEDKAKHWTLGRRLLQYIVFTELTETDVLLVEAGQQSNNNRAPLGQRITNQTDVPIIRVHAHWNTCVINTSIIGVRGFVRMQAYGKGRLLRRPVEIDPHTRKGYKREAKH